MTKKFIFIAMVILGCCFGCRSTTPNASIFGSSILFMEIVIFRKFEQPIGSTNYVTLKIPKAQLLELGEDVSDDNQGMVYLTSGARLNVKNPINQLKFEYSIINMPHKPNGVRRDFDEAIIKAQSLPSSAWRTYTIDTKPIMEEARKQYLNNALYQRDGMKVILTLYVDVNGDITQSVEYAALPGHTWTG